MGRTKGTSQTPVGQLRAFGLRYPGAHTKSPWPGHLDLAVKDKTFAYLSVDGDPISISCKLPHSADAALSLPFTTPTAYGLGKSGWVTATFAEDMPVPIELLEQWIDESYRAQAPKRLSAGLPEGGPSDASGVPVVASSGAAKTGQGAGPSTRSVRSKVRQARPARGSGDERATEPGRSKAAAPAGARRTSGGSGTATSGKPVKGPSSSGKGATRRSAAGPAARGGGVSKKAGKRRSRARG
jgi:predicted DNA-binding protein (MmcQ/YjbR family)